MVRQGNENDEVTIFRYVTESTFDSYSWQLIENKQKFIGQIMTSKSPARTCDDLDDAALSYAEVKALAAGNPLIKKKMDLDIQVSRLQNLKSAYISQHYRLEDDLTMRLPAEIRKYEGLIANYKQDIETLNAHTSAVSGDEPAFEMELKGIRYDKKEDAGKVLLSMVSTAIRAAEPISIGHYRGFEVKISYNAFSQLFTAHLVGASSHCTELGSDETGNITRLNNTLNGMERMVDEFKGYLERSHKQIEDAKLELEQPFPHEAELKEKSERLAALDALLGMDKNDAIIDTFPEDGPANRRDKTIQREDR